MTDFDLRFPPAANEDRDHAELLDSIYKQQQEFDGYMGELSEPLEEIEPWDYTAVRIGLAVVIVSFAIAIPGIWWWCCLMRDLWGML